MEPEPTSLDGTRAVLPRCASLQVGLTWRLSRKKALLPVNVSTTSTSFQPGAVRSEFCCNTKSKNQARIPPTLSLSCYCFAPNARMDGRPPVGRGLPLDY
jgi:hypothetical protein